MARLHRLEDEQGNIEDYRRMIPENAEKLNRQLESEGSNLRWKAGAHPKGEPPIRSLIQVMRALDCEGFTPYVANLVVRYHRTTLPLRAREIRDRMARQFRRFMKGQKPEDRKAVGRFISSQMGASLNGGIRLGLAAGLHRPSMAGLPPDDGFSERGVSKALESMIRDHSLAFVLEKLAEECKEIGWGGIAEELERQRERCACGEAIAQEIMAKGELPNDD